MSETDEFTFSGKTDSIPDRDNVASDLTCVVCGDPLTYAGRGRKPTRCALHKQGTSTGTKPGGRRQSASVARIRDESAKMVGTVGLLVTMQNQFDGGVLVNKAPEWGDAFGDLADASPAARKVLEKVFADAAYVKLVVVALSTTLPILWNHGAFNGMATSPERADAMAMFMARMGGFEVPANKFTVPDYPPNFDDGNKSDAGHVTEL